MSLIYIKEAGSGAKIGLWHITEEVEELVRIKSLTEDDRQKLLSFSHEHRKKEWFSARILLEQLGREKNSEIVYDEHNKPFLKNSKKHISLSHSHDLLAVILDDNETGIDIELIKPNVERIKEKFMSDTELKTLQKENLAEQLTLFWCVKESLYKLYGKKKLTFKEDLLLEPFEYSGKGNIRAAILLGGIKRKFVLHYEKITVDTRDYMLTYVVNEV